MRRKWWRRGRSSPSGRCTAATTARPSSSGSARSRRSPSRGCCPACPRARLARSGTGPQYFSSQAHPPALLLASVPLVRIVGGRGLYACILAPHAGGAGLDVAGAAPGRIDFAALPRRDAPRGRARRMAAGARRHPPGGRGDPGRSAGRGGVVGDASRAVGMGRRAGRNRWSGVAAGARCHGRSRPVAEGVLGGVPDRRRGHGATVLVTGPMVLVDFGRNVSFTATNYSSMLANYAVSGRVAHGGVAVLAVSALAVATMCAAAWYRARRVDAAFAFASLIGLLAAPLAWSQHLALALLPLAVLLRARGTCRHGVAARGLGRAGPCRLASGPGGRVAQHRAPARFVRPLAGRAVRAGRVVGVSAAPSRVNGLTQFGLLHGLRYSVAARLRRPGPVPDRRGLPSRRLAAHGLTPA